MTEITPDNSRPRVLSGMRPTGRLHLGNYMGALHNWVQLQHQYECYFFIADYHALTTDYADTSALKDNIREVALDFLAAGLDPSLCTIFIQSAVQPTSSFTCSLSMITPLSWLERVPTYKDQQEQLNEKDLATYGFLGYPLLQSADILVYQPAFVPVGQDQAAHVELTREVARRFNQFYSTRHTPAFEHAVSDKEKLAIAELTEDDRHPSSRNPKSSLPHPPNYPAPTAARCPRATTTPSCSPTPKPLSATSSRPWSPTRHAFAAPIPATPKSAPSETFTKSSRPTRPIRRYAKAARPPESAASNARDGVADNVVAMLAPMQERRRHYESHPEEVDAILEAGNARATARADQTMREVRSAMGLR